MSEIQNKQDPPFPWMAMSSLAVGMLAHSVVFTSPMPFVAFMIVDFKMSPNLDSAGYWAGWITGTFMIGRTIAGIPWGMASDKFGRKPCLMLSMLNVCILGVVFGCSTSFEMAILSRLAIGLGNGFMGVAKTSVTEISLCKSHEIRGFGMINGIWGLGMIVGPAVGGILSRPAIQYPTIFTSKTSIWAIYPYLLPSVVCAAIAFIAFFWIYLYLPETYNNHNNETIETIQYNELLTENSTHDIENKYDSNESIGTDNETTDEEVKEIELTDISNNKINENVSFLHKNHENIANNENEEIEINLYDSNDSKTLQTIDEQLQQQELLKLPSTFNEILTNKSIQFLFLIYMCFCFMVTFVDESLPLVSYYFIYIHS